MIEMNHILLIKHIMMILIPRNVQGPYLATLDVQSLTHSDSRHVAVSRDVCVGRE